MREYARVVRVVERDTWGVRAPPISDAHAAPGVLAAAARAPLSGHTHDTRKPATAFLHTASSYTINAQHVHN